MYNCCIESVYILIFCVKICHDNSTYFEHLLQNIIVRENLVKSGNAYLRNSHSTSR